MTPKSPQSPGQDLPNEFSIALGNLIREARNEAKLSQCALAEKIDYRQAAISAIENGKMEPTLSLLMSIAGALHKPVSCFIPPGRRYGTPLEEIGSEEMALLLSYRALSPVFQKVLISLARTLASLPENAESRPGNRSWE